MDRVYYLEYGKWRFSYKNAREIAELERRGIPLIIHLHNEQPELTGPSIDEALTPHKYRGRQESCTLCRRAKDDSLHGSQTETLEY